MSGGEDAADAAARLDPCVPDAVEEALILWQFCSAVADRIWARHEDALIERLIGEERAGRCEEHPWRGCPCTTCEGGDEPGERNLELVFEEERDARD